MTHAQDPKAHAAKNAPTVASSKWRQTGLRLVVLTALAAAGLLAWQAQNSAASTVDKVPPDAAKLALELLPQDTWLVASGAIRQSISLTGTLQPLNRIEVKSPLPGQVVLVNAREGDRVHKGQVLATLDDSDLQARLRDRLAALDGGQAQFALAAKTRANNEALLKQNFISQAAFDNSLSGYRTAEAGVKSLQAQVEQARKALGDTVIRSPMDGVVAERIAQPGLSVPVNGMLMTVQNLTEMELEVLVPTSQIPMVRFGQTATFGIEGFGERRFTGKVERISPSAAAGSRSISVFLRVANPDQQLRGGMFAQGAIVTDATEQVVVLPQAAVRQRDGASYVLRIEGDRLQQRVVELGSRDSNTGLVQISSGLVAGDRVVTSSGANLTSGQLVLVQPPAAHTDSAQKDKS